MGHCKSKLKQCNAVAQANKTKGKKVQEPTPLFQSTKILKCSSIQWKLHNRTIVQLLYSSLIRMDLILNIAAPC